MSLHLRVSSDVTHGQYFSLHLGAQVAHAIASVKIHSDVLVTNKHLTQQSALSASKQDFQILRSQDLVKLGV